MTTQVAPGSTRVGVVGVGRMGANIARRLHDAGYTIAAVADADPERARELGSELGATTPADPAGVMAASAPPQIMTSASPCWIMRKESPTACAEAEHAVAVAEFGPFAP